MRGDDVGHVDLPVGGLAPHAAAGRAGISIPLVFALVGDVTDDQRLVGPAHCRWRRQRRVMVTSEQPSPAGALLLSFGRNGDILPTSLFALHSSSETGRS